MKTIILQRYSDNKDDTLGLFFLDGRFCSYTLEDEYRKDKIKGETRIPAGEYLIRIREEDTPLTLKYRGKYAWFENHIEILDIPNFKGVYIHIGNYDENTDGCVLLGDAANNNTIGKGVISYSTNAYERFYKEVFPELKAGIPYKIIIRDEIELNLGVVRDGISF